MLDAALGLNLSTTFNEAQQRYDRLFQQIEAGAPRDDAFRTALEEGIAWLQATEIKIRQAALFSENEAEGDLQLQEYPYLLVNAWLATLTDAITTRDATERYKVLQQVETYDEAFLDQLEWYDLLSTEHLAQRSRFTSAIAAQKSAQNEENEQRHNVPREALRINGPSREEKIARYKQKRELQAQLAEMRQNGKMNTVAFYKTWLSLTAQERLEQQDLYIMEKGMLQMAQRQKQPMREERDSRTLKKQEEDAAWRLDVQKDAIFNAKGQPMRPFILHNNKEAIRQRVFQPGHNLPTMTIDEYLANEAKRGNVLSGGTNEDVAREKALKEAQEDDDRDNEEVWRKAVAWDDFKDDNPRGWGNKGFNKG